MSIEAETASLLAHRERTAAHLAEFDGLAPDHHAMREAIRLAVLKAIDDTTKANDWPRMSDGELPRLFAALDAISEATYIQSLPA